MGGSRNVGLLQRLLHFHDHVADMTNAEACTVLVVSLVLVHQLSKVFATNLGLPCPRLNSFPIAASYCRRNWRAQGEAT